MKILICTQKVDKNDPVLGFFHGWLIELSKYFERITVICLQKGEYDLPKNVTVLSLGKTEDVFGVKRIYVRFRYVWRLYLYILRERDRYDSVFIHMNPEYVALGGLVWRFFRKKIFLWYNHKKGNVMTDIAAFLSEKIFYTSSSAYTASHARAEQMPVGIDSDLFKKDPSIIRNERTILFLGRISPTKKIDILIDALLMLNEQEVNFKASIYGDAPARDRTYYRKLLEQGHPLVKNKILEFHSGVPHHDTPRIYNEHAIFVNLTPAGSFDKTIFEAALCGMTIISSNNSLEASLFEEFLVEQDNVVQLAERLQSILNRPTDFEEAKEKVRLHVLHNHTLLLLAKKLTEAMREENHAFAK